MKTLLAVTALTALALTACDRPTGAGAEGSKVGAAMPDTTQPRGDDPLMTTPDAGATGAVPADGSTPPAASTPADQPATSPATEAPK